MANNWLLGLSVVVFAILISNAECRVPSESEIYTSTNRLADGLTFLASLARQPATVPATSSSSASSGRRRTASGDAMTSEMKQATTSLTAQICTPACTRIATKVSSPIIKAIFPCTSVCEMIDVGLQSLVGMIVHFAAGPPPAAPAPSGR